MMLFKYAIRNIKKHLFLNLIKTVGLSLGLCGILFISLFLKSQMSYDIFHKKADRIYRITLTSQLFFGNNHFARIINSELMSELSDELPEIEKFVRLKPIRDQLIVRQEQRYSIEQAFEVDDTFFELFDAEFLKGNPNTVLLNPGSTVISESFALKVFGDEDPIGKTLSLPTGHFNTEKKYMTVTGVIKDFSQESHFHPNLLFMPGSNKIRGWGYTYLLVKEKVNLQLLMDKISLKFTEMYAEDNDTTGAVKAHLMNIKDIHLNSNLHREIEPNGSKANIYVFVIAAFILLFISLSNFMSLNLGMAGYLSRFLGLNQVLGSPKYIVINYFFIESCITVFSAILIVVLTCIPINLVLLAYYQINFLRGNALFTLAIVCLFGLLGVMTGLQPLLKNRLENFTLLDSLKGKGSLNSHRYMVISQFIMVMVLLVGVIVISEQTRFAFKKSMGSDRNNIICIPLVHNEIQKDCNVFKDKLLRQNAIVSVSAMMDSPGGETHDMFPFVIEDAPQKEENEHYIGVFSCDYSFADVFGLTFLSGRNFSNNNRDQEDKGEYIINETAMRFLGFHDPQVAVGKAFAIISPVKEVHLPRGKIIGVVKDFHLSGLQTKVEPLVLFKREDKWLHHIVIAYNPILENEAIAKVAEIWANLFPKYPFDYLHVSTMYKKVYKTELLQRNLIFIFTIISILISTMGLIGLSLMVSQRRRKEIGIRKVNGANISEILIMLTKDFLSWLVIALVLAIPVAFLAAHTWLEGFAYKINISWWMFLLAGVSTMFITMVTVSWYSYKAAKQNPVESLRIE